MGDLAKIKNQKSMHLLIGLGNIGREYESTRHNFGFLLLDQIIADHDLQAQGEKFRSEVFVGEIAGEKILALKPQTFMNLSGRAVAEAASFYKIPPKDILVFHDEIDLSLGRVKIKVGGGNAGHNGLKSIDEAVGRGYVRIRLGVGRSDNQEIAVADHVLGKFSATEMQQVRMINERISKLIGDVVLGEFNLFLNRLNQHHVV